MKSDITTGWEERDPQYFADHDLLQMQFSRVYRYKVDGRFDGLDVLLKIVPHGSSPSVREVRDLWGERASVTINMPTVYSREFLMLLKLLRYDFVFDTDVLHGYQEALGVRLRKLVLVPDNEVPGEVLSYIHAMNEVGDGTYFKVSIHDGLAFALSHRNVPIYASEKLFWDDHLRVKRREMASLESKYRILSTMTWKEKVQKAIDTATPMDFELYASRAVLSSVLSKEELEELRDIAVTKEKYEWAHFLMGILEL